MEAWYLAIDNLRVVEYKARVVGSTWLLRDTAGGLWPGVGALRDVGFS